MAATVNMRRWTPLGLLSGGAAWAFGMYAGSMLLVPLVVSGAAWWLYHRLLPVDRRPVVPVLAVETGHIVWFALGVLVPGGLVQVAPDLAVLTVLTVWLGWRLSRIAGALLIVVHLLSGAFNVWSLTHVSLMEPAGKAIVCHLLWRVIAIGLIAWFLSGRAGAASARTAAAETFN